MPTKPISTKRSTSGVSVMKLTTVVIQDTELVTMLPMSVKIALIEVISSPFYFQETTVLKV